MGSPVSDVIANMVMEDVEQRALATSPVKSFFWFALLWEMIELYWLDSVRHPGN